MDPRALGKSYIRLRVAQQTMEKLRQIENFVLFSGEWYIFLTALKNIYTILEQGAKTSPQSRQWFGKKKAERRNDPLLQYLYHARNDVEHGLEPVLEEGLGRFLFELPDAGKNGRIIGYTHDPITGEMEVYRPDGGPIKLIGEREPGIELATVKGRGGEVFAPPIVHKGRPIGPISPIAAGELGLAYMLELIQQAEKLYISSR